MTGKSLAIGLHDFKHDCQTPVNKQCLLNIWHTTPVNKHNLLHPINIIHMKMCLFWALLSYKVHVTDLLWRKWTIYIVTLTSTCTCITLTYLSCACVLIFLMQFSATLLLYQYFTWFWRPAYTCWWHRTVQTAQGTTP